MEVFSKDHEELCDMYDEYGKPTHKVCSSCGELKPVSEFYKNGRNVDGSPRYRRDCKSCYKVGNSERVKEYRDRKWLEKYGMPDLEVIEVDE